METKAFCDVIASFYVQHKTVPLAPFLFQKQCIWVSPMQILWIVLFHDTLHRFRWLMEKIRNKRWLFHKSDNLLKFRYSQPILEEGPFQKKTQGLKITFSIFLYPLAQRWKLLFLYEDKRAISREDNSIKKYKGWEMKHFTRVESQSSGRK